jgi:hypothetical protein
MSYSSSGTHPKVSEKGLLTPERQVHDGLLGGRLVIRMALALQ